MPSPLQAIAELPQFVRDAEAAGLTEDEHRKIVDTIAAKPLQGDEIRGSGGVRKVRFAGRGKGTERRIPGRDRLFRAERPGVSLGSSP